MFRGAKRSLNYKNFLLGLTNGCLGSFCNFVWTRELAGLHEGGAARPLWAALVSESVGAPGRVPTLADRH